MSEGAHLRLVDDTFKPSDAPKEARRGGSGGAGGGGMDQRVAAMEKQVEKLDGKIDKLTELVHGFGLKTSERLSVIEGRLTGIEKVLDTKAAKTDLTSIENRLGSLDGRLANVPTFWQMIFLVATLLVGLAGVLFGAAKLLGTAPEQPKTRPSFTDQLTPPTREEGKKFGGPQVNQPPGGHGG